MSTDYAILRIKRGLSTNEPFSLPSIGAAGDLRARYEPTEIMIEQAKLNATQLADHHADPGVVGIAPLMPTRLIAPVREPGAPPQIAAGPAWGIVAIGASTSQFDGSGVTVAVLDTGIEKTHPAFQGVTIIEQDFSSSGNGDRNGHGTHCAGTIFGQDVGGTRIGVARGVSRAVIGKVLDDQGVGTSDGILLGLQWAIEERAQVISMSLGYDFEAMMNGLIQQNVPAPAAISMTLSAYRANLRLFDRLMSLLQARAAFGADALVVAAAGNEAHRPKFTVETSLPAAASGITSVAAVQQANGNKLSVARFSNTFPQLAAPGVDIVSAGLNGGLVTMSGTSMAAPHVAGAAVLHWQAMERAANSLRVNAKLLATAQNARLAAGTQLDDVGAGVVTCPQ